MGVSLQLLPAHGNPTSRDFPHHGYLGLTPVRLAGKLKTRLDEERRPLCAQSVTVALKCYESRVSRLGSTSTAVLVNVSQTLWTAPEGEQYGSLGDMDFSFKLVLPTDCAGQSSSNFQTYRVFWRIEAAIDHVPIPGVGSRQVKCFDVALTRHSAPSLPHNRLRAQSYRLARSPAHPALALHYQLIVPSQPVAPSEPISIACKLCPLDGGLVPVKITTSIERRIDLAPESPVNSVYGETSTGSALSSTATLVAGTTPPSRSFSGPSSTSKLLVLPLSSVESTDLTPESDGSYVQFLTSQLPAQKSSHHWSIGETMHTSLATVRFFVCAKICVQLPSGTTEWIPLDDKELYVVAIDELERRRIINAVTSSSSRPRTAPLAPPPSSSFPRTRSSKSRESSWQCIENTLPRPSNGSSSPATPLPPTMLKVLPVRHSKPLGGGAAAAMLGKRPHTSSGLTPGREEGARRNQRPRSAKGAEPAGAAVRPSVASEGDADLSRGPFKTLLSNVQNTSPALYSLSPAKSLPRSTMMKVRPREVMAVKTYVHEPVDNIELVGKQGMVGTLGAGGVPGGLSAIRREDILEWELEVERFSSASARLAL